MERVPHLRLVSFFVLIEYGCIWSAGLQRIVITAVSRSVII